MPGPSRVQRGLKPTVDNPGKVFGRLIKYIFKDFGLHFIAVFVLI